jgi:hypothetical protein
MIGKKFVIFFKFKEAFSLEHISDNYFFIMCDMIKKKSITEKKYYSFIFLYENKA